MNKNQALRKILAALWLIRQNNASDDGAVGEFNELNSVICAVLTTTSSNVQFSNDILQTLQEALFPHDYADFCRIIAWHPSIGVIAEWLWRLTCAHGNDSASKESLLNALRGFSVFTEPDPSIILELSLALEILPGLMSTMLARQSERARKRQAAAREGLEKKLLFLEDKLLKLRGAVFNCAAGSSFFDYAINSVILQREDVQRKISELEVIEAPSSDPAQFEATVQQFMLEAERFAIEASD